MKMKKHSIEDFELKEIGNSTIIGKKDHNNEKISVPSQFLQFLLRKGYAQETAKQYNHILFLSKLEEGYRLFLFFDEKKFDLYYYDKDHVGATKLIHKDKSFNFNSPKTYMIVIR
jgi:hypothetical protein